MLRNSLIEKFSALAILTTAAAVSPSLYAAPGDGHGFNGPTLSPISIPVQVDRLLTVPEARSAVVFCAAGEAPGFKSLQQRVSEALYGANPPYLELYIDPRQGVIPGDAGEDCEDRKLCDRSFFPPIMQGTVKSLNSGLPEGAFSFGKDSYDEPTLLEFAPDLHKLRSNLVQERVSLVADKFIPYVGFSDVAEDTQYDEWGRETLNTAKYSTVKIIAPQDYEKPMHFFNRKTNHPINLTIDLTEYVECLQAQIQKIN